MVSPTDIKYVQRLRGARLSKNIKQSEASDLLGFKNQQQYSKLENGHLPFTDEIILAICDKFEITPEQFTESNPYNFVDSPYANSQNGSNNSINDIHLIQDILKLKDELLKSKDETLKAQEELIRLKDQLLKVQDQQVRAKL